jgi:glycosyltransferase involved in cell wall biosynthesis
MLFSLIIPVYNRPDDLREVLDGLAAQTDPHFEVVVVESGSTVPARHVVEEFTDRLDVHYAPTGNHGQGFSRNHGMQQARGDYFIILDSDIIIPPHYIETVRQQLANDYLDAFGGPDRAHSSFTPVQKAVDFALTSYLTTGGIRGNRRQAARYRPRSFNMGFSRAVYEATQGFALPNCGEDIELSIRIQKLGYRTGLIPGAYVYHKRKETLRGFYQQMVWFGKSRINLHRIEPGSLKAIHLIPLLFFVYLAITLVLGVVIPPLGAALGGLLLVYAGAVLVTATVRYRSLLVGALSVATAFTVFVGYGYGLIKYHFLQQEPYTPIAS